MDIHLRLLIYLPHMVERSPQNLRVPSVAISLRLHRHTLRLLPASGYAADRKQETFLEACNDQIGTNPTFAGTLSDFVTITVIGFSYACYRRRRMRNISKTMQDQLIAHVVLMSKIWERRRGSRDEALASITFIACASA